MKNVTVTTKGNILTIAVDLAKSFGPSKTGKTTIVASTEGNQPVGGNFPTVKVGLNVFKSLDAEA